MNISTTTSKDNKRVLFCTWEGPVSTTLSFTAEQTREAIAELSRELAVIEKCAKLEAVRAKAEQLLAEEAA